MLYKVCGMREKTNVAALSDLPIHMVGLNFYPESKRYISDDNPEDAFDSLSDDISLVGVFVKEEFDVVVSYIDSYQLDYVQLHGGETSMYCNAMKDLAGVIKVFSVDDDFDFLETKEFEEVDYFLFDTKSKEHGGSGKKFDWAKLDQYKGNTPFLLAGGIGPNDYELILQLKHKRFAGVDLNSKFENSPALKDIGLIKNFVKQTSV